MELIVHKKHRIRHPADVHGIYPSIFSEIELIHDFDLSDRLQNSEAWNTTKSFGKQSQRAEAKPEVFEDFYREFGQLKEQFFSLTMEDRYFSYHWKKDPTWYFENFRFRYNFYKDSPGHQMSPHVDNRHIVAQAVINAVDNTASTEIYAFDSLDPIYQSRREKNHGVIFLNQPGSVHGIRNVTTDRYILYVAVML